MNVLMLCIVIHVHTCTEEQNEYKQLVQTGEGKNIKKRQSFI